MEKIGFIVNPVAGIGGKVGLKGSDGKEMLERALGLGAVPESGKKALMAMRVLKASGELPDIYTCPGNMGEDVCKAAGLNCKIIDYTEDMPDRGGGRRLTAPEDTVCAARKLCSLGVSLILFAGGDGTARDILDAIGTDTAVLGIPAGCKIHSGVYAVNPEKAGELAVRYVQGSVRETKEAEVMDIDEDAFREGRVQSRLYGYLKIPHEIRMVQGLKCGNGFARQNTLERLAEYMADIWEPDTLYIVGGGSTTEKIMKKMNLSGTLLGVDLVYDHEVIAADCTEKEILGALDRFAKRKILVTVIGGQGYIFGRGNQQISAGVIRRVGRENIIVAASEEKMLALFGKYLYTDTGDRETDRYLAGYIRVIVGYGEFVMMKVSD